MSHIFTTKQETRVTVDDDFAFLAKWSWQLNSVGYLRRTIYVSSNPRKYKTLLMHRFIMNVNDPSLVIDHINGDKYDNRKSNLRVCSQSENLANRHVIAQGKTSRYLGVHYTARKDQKFAPWKAQLNRSGKHYYKSYLTEEEAHKGYSEMIRQFGYEWEKLDNKHKNDL